MSADKRLLPIADFCARADLTWDHHRAERMSRYLDLLLQFNQAMNLIGPLTAPEVVDQLLLDSLIATAARAPQGPILDVGCGAGLPGIPIKIVFPDCPLTLVEPRQKRSTFLKIATHRLELRDVDVLRCRIEDFDGDRFDTVISKAFEAPTKWLATARPFIADRTTDTSADTGAVIVMGRRSDEQALLDAAKPLGLELAGQAPGPGEGPEQRVYYAFGLPGGSSVDLLS